MATDYGTDTDYKALYEQLQRETNEKLSKQDRTVRCFIL